MDMPRASQRFSGAPKPGPIAQAHAAQRDLDQEQFERQCADYQAPTAMRPALLTADEARQLGEKYTTGQGRLKALRAVIAYREAYLDEQAGQKPFDPLSDEQRKRAKEFFQTNGYARAGAPRVAPPNPVKAAEPAVVAAAPAVVAPPAPVRADPAPLPAAAPALTVAAPSATLEIEFVSAQGYVCRLTLHAPSGTQVLEQGKAAMTKLQEQQAKPPSVPAPAAASGETASHTGEPPKCKYHGVEMKPSKKPGTWFCPKKIGDGAYCDYKIGE